MSNATAYMYINNNFLFIRDGERNNFTNLDSLIVGSINQVSVDLTLSTTVEPAFKTQLRFNTPRGLLLRSLSPTFNNLPQDTICANETMNNMVVHTCDYDNPTSVQLYLHACACLLWARFS